MSTTKYEIFFGKLNKVATESGGSSTELQLLLHIHTCILFVLMKNIV